MLHPGHCSPRKRFKPAGQHHSAARAFQLPYSARITARTLCQLHEAGDHITPRTTSVITAGRARLIACRKLQLRVLWYPVLRVHISRRRRQVRQQMFCTRLSTCAACKQAAPQVFSGHTQEAVAVLDSKTQRVQGIAALCLTLQQQASRCQKQARAHHIAHPTWLCTPPISRHWPSLGSITLGMGAS